MSISSDIGKKSISVNLGKNKNENKVKINSLLKRYKTALAFAPKVCKELKAKVTSLK